MTAPVGRGRCGAPGSRRGTQYSLAAQAQAASEPPANLNSESGSGESELGSLSVDAGRPGRWSSQATLSSILYYTSLASHLEKRHEGLSRDIPGYPDLVYIPG